MGEEKKTGLNNSVSDVMELPEDEKDAPTINQKIQKIVVKSKKKPLIPDLNRVDKIVVKSFNEKSVDVSCRCLFKNQKPLEDLNVKIVLPRRQSIINRLVRRNPKLKDKQLEKELEKWINSFIKKQLSSMWRRKFKTRPELIINEHPQEVEDKWLTKSAP